MSSQDLKPHLDALEKSCWLMAETLDQERNRLFKDISDYWKLREIAQVSLGQVRMLKRAAGVPLVFAEERKVSIWQPEMI